MSYTPSSNIITPEQFKRSSDTDDTASFLRAFDAFRLVGSGEQAGGTLYLSGGYTISDTLLISSLGITLDGIGWGNTRHAAPSGTWIKWNGTAGKPMVKFLQTFNAGLDNIRLVGNSAAKPSCGVEFADTATDSFAWNYLNRVWIGHFLGYDSDNALQFDNGIIASGTVNGDSNTFNHVSIAAANVGMDIQNPNFSDTHCNGLFINYCQIGLKIKGATLTGTNWFFGLMGDTCFRLLDGSKLQVTDFLSEKCARLATFDDGYGSGKLLLRGGAFQVDNQIAADGRIIDTGIAKGWNIHLDDFHVQIVSPFTGPIHKIRAYHTAGGVTNGTLRMLGVKGIYPRNLELGSWIWTTDARDVIYEPAMNFGQDAMPRQSWRGAYDDGAADQSFRVFASDQTGEHTLRGGPFKVRRLLIDPLSVAATPILGSGAIPYSYRVTALTYDGETTPTAAVTCTNGTLAAGTNVNNIRWSYSQGAYAYRIYGRTAGSELLLKTVTWNDLHPGDQTGDVTPPSWNDDGSLTPVGALPTVNTTGNLSIGGKVTLGTIGTPPAPADGDMWFDGTALKIRIAGVTKTVTVS